MSNAAIAVSTALWRMTFSASAELSRKELKHAVAQLEAAEKHLDSMAEKVLREARIGHPFALDLEKRVCLDRNGTYVPVRMHSNSNRSLQQIPDIARNAPHNNFGKLRRAEKRVMAFFQRDIPGKSFEHSFGTIKPATADSYLLRKEKGGSCRRVRAFCAVAGLVQDDIGEDRARAVLCDADVFIAGLRGQRVAIADGLLAVHAQHAGHHAGGARVNAPILLRMNLPGDKMQNNSESTAG